MEVLINLITGGKELGVLRVVDFGFNKTKLKFYIHMFELRK